MASVPFVLIDVRDEEGATGRSYLRTYTPLALRALGTLVQDIAPLITGSQKPPEAVNRDVRNHFGLLGTRGLVGAAIAGLDMALWDLDARQAGVPLARHLGSDIDRVPAYQSLRAIEPGAAAEEAGAAVAAGFTAVKVKLGHGSLDDDLAVIEAIRTAVGPTAGLMVDYNQSLSTADAIRRGQALDERGLAWIEEPTDAHDRAGNAQIAAALRTPVNAGENLEGPTEAAAALTAGACDGLSLDAMKIGGVTGWIEAAAHAARAGAPVSSHAFPEFSVHLLAASPTRQWLERHDLVAPILQEPVTVEDGYALVPDRPGAGLEWDEGAVSRLTG
jgi:mandelate racemase